MPTAAKLIGAISFLLVAFFAAETVKPVFPEGFSFGYFSAVCAWIGFLVGGAVLTFDLILVIAFLMLRLQKPV